jgi:hypothetical protein
MNDALAMSRGWEMTSTGEALTLPGSISESTAKQLSGSADVLLRTTFGLLEECIISAIEKRSAADFKVWREQNFAAYFNAVLGLPSLMKFAVPTHVIERLNREFFCELEADLRDRGVQAFGSAVRDQAMFTAWTLRKITDLIAQIPADSSKTIQEQKSHLTQLVIEFACSGIWARFHLHCLVSSLRLGKPIYPEPLELILEGLRAAVNTYAIARRLLDALSPLPTPQMDRTEWDSEDDELLAEASRDMLAEPA